MKEVQSIFTPEFQTKLKTIGINDIPEMIQSFKQLTIHEMAEDVFTSKKKCLYPNGRGIKKLFQRSLLRFIMLMEEEVKGKA